MKKLILYRTLLLFAAFSLVVVTGCFFLVAVNQPATADTNTQIVVTLDVQMDETGGGAGGGPSSGLCAVLIPTDWTVDMIEYDGDYGPAELNFLHPDSIDNSPGEGVDYWYDTLLVRYPPPQGMDWHIYQGESDADHLWLGDTTDVTVTVTMTTGAAGTYNIGYFVTTTDLSFEDATWTDVSLDNEIQVGAAAIDEELPLIATEFALEQNFPNPFNPVTKISYMIKKHTLVNLTVYDLFGREIAVLVNGVKTAGTHQVEFDAKDLSSGVYIYRLTAGNFSTTKKMALLK